jgi:hypothetical protein
VIFLADDRNLGGGGVDVQAAVQGISISQDVNPAAMFGGAGMAGVVANGNAGGAVSPASLF